MEFLKLELRGGKVINVFNKGVFSKDFFFPFNNRHVYNMLCTLLDKTPMPQNRKVNSKYMPFYNNVMDAVLKGYVKIECVSSFIKVTAMKGAYNSNVANDAVKQITWRDCQNRMGEQSFTIFKDILKNDFDIDYDKRGYLLGFENTMSIIINCGNQTLIDSLKNWFKKNTLTVFINYLENHPEYKGSLFGKSKIPFNGKEVNKRIYKGILDSEVYNATFYIPFNNELKEEYLKYSKGWTTMLDGGLVKAIEFTELYSDDIIEYLEIKDLLPLRKSDLLMNKDVVDFNKLNEYRTVSKNIKSGKSISKVDIITLFNKLDLEYNDKDMNVLFSKDITEEKITGLIKKIRNRNFWNIEKVKNIYKKLNLEYKDDDLDFGKSDISASSINRKIEKIINNKLKLN